MYFHVSLTFSHYPILLFSKIIQDIMVEEQQQGHMHDLNVFSQAASSSSRQVQFDFSVSTYIMQHFSFAKTISFTLLNKDRSKCYTKIYACLNWGADIFFNRYLAIV